MTEPVYKILIVDDNPHNLFTLRTIINQYVNAEVLEANSGGAALNILFDNMVDLIILDIQMEGMDGFETASIIKNRKKTRDIPIIFLTAAYISDEFQKRGFKIGAADYLTKPIDDYQLVNRINVYLKLIEKERIINKDLEQKVEEKTSQLREALKIAEAANKAKSLFVAHISHELRTPLNGIIGMSRLLNAMDMTDSQQEYIEIINSSAHSLLDIINDILDLSKIESGKMTIEEIDFDIRELIDKVQKVFMSYAAQKSLDLNCGIDGEVPDILTGDPVRIKQIIINLINNAIKFTESGEVKTSIKLVESMDSDIRLKISVIDTGIGIPEDKIGDLFQSYYQIDNSYTRQHTGTGLGLSIVKELAELMEGTVEVQSTPGKGSVFSVIIPLGVSEKHKIEDIEKTGGLVSNTGRKANILLAEDNNINQLVISKMLEQKGWTVKVVNNGRSVVEEIEKSKYDLVLMDIGMPEMDGFESTLAIRKRERARGGHIPIIALTAYTMDGDKEKCMEIGMDDYVTKPISGNEIFEKVEKYL